MSSWSRSDTRLWISQIEKRLSDIQFYLEKTLQWCEENDIYDDRYVFILSFMSCLWVCNMRNENITYNELLEILGLENMTVNEDKVYDLGNMFQNLDHYDLLAAVLKTTEI